MNNRRTLTMGKVKEWMQDQVENMTDAELQEYEDTNAHQDDLFSVLVNAHKESMTWYEHEGQFVRKGKDEEAN
tara:strand:- start:136 stop:354 length:219 start_codon:yes stop_codon:yes gene_type:complete